MTGCASPASADGSSQLPIKSPTCPVPSIALFWTELSDVIPGSSGTQPPSKQTKKQITTKN